MQWTFLTFFTIFELGSAICGAASSSYMLIVGRAIAGIGSSGLLNGAFTILHASFPAQRLPSISLHVALLTMANWSSFNRDPHGNHPAGLSVRAVNRGSPNAACIMALV